MAKLAHRFQPITKYIRDDTIKRVLKRARSITGKPPKAEGLDASIDQGTEVLIQAHRLMQLSADRAGLWFAEDLRAAILAMFKLRPTYLAELPIAKRSSLPEALQRRSDDGVYFLGDLAMRVGALFDFMVSEELEELPTLTEARVGT